MVAAYIGFEPKKWIQIRHMRIKEVILITLFMIMNLFVITGILLQIEKDLNDKPAYNVERILMQTNESDNEILKTIKEKSGKKSPFEYNQ